MYRERSSTVLAHSVLKSVLWSKLAGAMVVILAVALAAATTAVVGRGSTPEAPEEPTPVLATAPTDDGAGKPQARMDAFGDPLPEGAIARLGTIRYRVCGGLNHAALSPDGKFLATTYKGGIAIYDLATGKPRYFRDSSVTSFFETAGSHIAFSPDGKQVLNTTRGGNLCFWEVGMGKRLRIVGNRPEPPPGGPEVPRMIPPPLPGTLSMKVWFPLQGTEVVVGTVDNFAVFLSPSTGKILHRFQAAGEPASVAEDGKTLIAIDAKRPEVILYDDRGKELRRFRHEGKADPATPATLCQEGKRLVTVNDKAEIKVWDVASGKLQQTIPGPAIKSAARKPSVVSITPDGNTLLAGTWGGDILRWDLGSGKESEPLRGHEGWVTSLLNTSNGRTLISLGMDNVIRRWNLPSGEAGSTGEGYAFFLRVARSPDGKTIAVASSPGRLEFWDSAESKRLRSFSLPAGDFSQIRFAPEGKLLALGCYDGKLRLWDVAKGRVSREWKMPVVFPSGENNDGWLMGLAWSPDGRFLATSGDRVGLSVWDAASGKEIWRWTHQSVVNNFSPLAFSTDGKTLVSQSPDHALRFHDAATGKVRIVLRGEGKSFDSMSDIAFSRDGSCLATCYNGGVIALRDPKTGEVRKTLQGDGLVESISFSPDSKWLASAGLDRTVRLWEVATGAEVWRRQGHEGWITQVEFGSDGRTVLSASNDLTALLWDVRPNIQSGRKKSMETLWDDLAGEPAQAYRAVWELAGDPKAASEFLRKKIAPVKRVMEERRLQALVADLGSDNFAVRQKATAELEKAGEQALPAFRKALEIKPSLESRRRLEDLMQNAQRSWEDLSRERLRSFRAIEALELAGTAEARGVLQMLAAGADGARLTHEAKAALRRLQG